MIPVWRWTVTVVVGILTCGAWAETVSSPPASTLPADQELDLQTLKRQLGDPKRTAETRLDAARMLLTKPHPRAGQILQQFLSDPSNTPAQQAVAEAIAEDGGGRKEFVAPLMAMLTGDEPQVRASAARALVTYQNHGVTDRLIRAAKNTALDRGVRRVTIEALQRIVAKRCMEALIELLGDPDPAIRSAAADSLRRMTNLRRFGSSRSMWTAWFEKRRNGDEVAWLREMNDGLTRARMSLERENAQLRARLIEAMESLYNAAPKTQRPAILLAFLNDSISEVRLLGETLTDRMITANQEIPPEVRQRVRLMLYDDDPRVRESAAVLEANLADAKTIGLLLGRLRAEQAPGVRVGLLKALGRLASPEAIPALLNEIRSRGDEEASAAAAALGRIAEDKPLDEANKAKALKVLVQRYHQSREAKNSLTLRESLLSALGSLGDEKARPVLIAALGDPAPVIRMVAVGGLLHLQARDAAAAIAPLVQDEDRGVRQAALGALITLGGKDYLKTILRRTDPKIESDSVVRKEAVDGVLSICARADVPTLDEILASLDKQAGSTDLRIQVLLRKAEVLKAARAPGLAEPLRKAGRLLMANDRAGEATPVLAEAWRLLAADPKQSAVARKVWLEYVLSMLDVDQPTVVRVIAEQTNPVDRTRALGLLFARLKMLNREQKYLAVIALADGAERQLTEFLSDAQKQQLHETLSAARKQQRALDRQQMEKLLPDLLSADVATREDAQKTLKTMGARAVRPLLEELRGTVEAATPDAERENALYNLLKQILPDAGPYDPTAQKAQRLAKIDAWLKKTK